MCNIRRRKAWANKQRTTAAATATETPAVGAGEQDQSDEDQRSSSSTSSLSEYSTLMDENKRLKKENGDLSSELTSMKRKCKDLLDLVAKYANMEEDDRDHHQQIRRPLKLFGVRLEVEGEREMRKRKRAEISESASILLSQSCK